ncbi:hypothetical protein [Flammeovirga sp. SJP92]|uniref:hypothetical protein n=1 Tax=Flammeovirga sp. SJP92 TaxID=1775430 RepID=UPI0012F9725B|nr:hypothetical protein [Flammeovirga sp. SJP92]
MDLNRKDKTLHVKKFFSSKIYKIDELIRWEDLSNTYRVNYNRVVLYFKEEKLDIFDHSDSHGVSELHYYLKKHFQDFEK